MNVIQFPRSKQEKLETERLWFWFIEANNKRGNGILKGELDPLDVLKIVDRLYRHNYLRMEHLLVMRHYGRKGCAPDCECPLQKRACKLWAEAMEKLNWYAQKTGILIEFKKII